MIWISLIVLAGIAAPLIRERMRADMDDTVRGSAKGQFAVLSGGVTHFAWHGPKQGPICVCVHGLTTPGFVWQGMTAPLTQMGFRVLTFDLFGRGYSDRPKGRQDAEFFIDQLRELLDHEGVGGDLTLIGYSMGGAISTAFAASYPERVRQLILLAPAGMSLKRDRIAQFIIDTPLIGDWLMLCLYPASLRRGLQKERLRYRRINPEITRLQAQELRYRGFLPAVLSSLRGLLAESRAEDHKLLHEKGLPVLAIWGQEDKVIPLSALGTLTEWSRNSQQEVVKGAGHALPYTHTDAVMRLIRDKAAVEEV